MKFTFADPEISVLMLLIPFQKTEVYGIPDLRKLGVGLLWKVTKTPFTRLRPAEDSRTVPII